VRNIDRNHRRAAKKKAKFAGESLNDFAREALRGCEAEETLARGRSHHKEDRIRRCHGKHSRVARQR
jgi:hypothetical protein